MNMNNTAKLPEDLSNAISQSLMAPRGKTKSENKQPAKRDLDRRFELKRGTK